MNATNTSVTTPADNCDRIDELVAQLNAAHRGVLESIEHSGEAYEEACAACSSIIDEIKAAGNAVKYSYGTGEYFRKYDASGLEMFCVTRDLRHTVRQYVAGCSAGDAIERCRFEYLNGDGDGELPEPEFFLEESQS